MKKHFSFYVLVILLLNACSYTGEFRQVETDGTFEISFPDYMKETNELKADAVLQYSNKYRNTYAIVEHQEKGNLSFEDFQQQTLDVLKNYELFEMPLVTDSSYEETSFGKAIHVQLYGVMQDENIYYWHSAYETKDKYFQVVIWTRSMDRKKRYGADIQEIINSFKPI